jgi:prepilin-type N-terminal cleavage/methylation domain-containing protein
MRRNSRAFTLLEVMAAVAVVAIVFTTLARVASEGLRSEGVSRRRLEASLLADRTLVEIETGLSAGVAPEIGESESEEGLYRVTIRVASFDLASALPAGGLGGIDPTAQPTLPGVIGSDVSPVRSIRIEVAWPQGVEELSVVRQTYGLDPVALEAIANADGGTPTIPGDEPSS